MIFERESGAAAPPEPSPEDAKREIGEIMANPTDLYHAPPGQPGHGERVEEVAALFRTAYPESPATEADATAPEGGEPAPARPALPAGMQHDEAAILEVEAAVKDRGLPPETVQRILEWDAECWRATDSPSAEQCVAVLQGRWGADWERKVEIAKWFIQQSGFVSVAGQAHLDASQSGNHPDMVILAAEEGARVLAEREQIRHIHADPTHPYNVKSHPQHHAAVGELQALYRRAYGTWRAG